MHFVKPQRFPLGEKPCLESSFHLSDENARNRIRLALGRNRACAEIRIARATKPQDATNFG
jgi:hypothetical protein